jgi:hypothetical protein
VVQIDGRPESALESQIGEESGVAGDSGGQSTRGARRRMGLIFWKRSMRVAF